MPNNNDRMKTSLPVVLIAAALLGAMAGCAEVQQAAERAAQQSGNTRLANEEVKPERQKEI